MEVKKSDNGLRVSCCKHGVVWLLTDVDAMLSQQI